MAELTRWQDLPAGGVRRARLGGVARRRPATGGRPAGRRSSCPQCVELPALLALLPRLGDRARRHDDRPHRLRRCKGCEICVEVCPDRRALDGRGADRMIAVEQRLLTGGEAVAHAMRQIDPDVVPVYPITPQTPIIQTFASMVADGQAHDRDRQRRVRALGDERRDRISARRRAHDDRDVLARARADGRGRLHRRLHARADRDGGRKPRALRADQHPLRPLRLDARSATRACCSSSPRTRRRHTT